MRTAFIKELILQARERPDIFLLVGDLGYSVVEPFVSEFPTRFLNVGVAEQNMTGIAAGLASEGYHVFTYSIANFPTLRCLEQIRNDVCYHELPVTIVSVGAGLAYGNLGYSHHAIQDIAILRTMPGITALSPADPGETRECVRWLSANPTPSYLRLGKAGDKQLHSVQGLENGPLKIVDGKTELALVCTGSILKLALEISDRLSGSQLQPTVFSCPWLKPVTPMFFAELAKFEQILVLEEHVSEGGLRSILLETLELKGKISHICIPDFLVNKVGTQDYLFKLAGIDCETILHELKF